MNSHRSANNSKPFPDRPAADGSRTAPKISGGAQGNIESIAQIEQEFVRRRSRVVRLGEAISGFAGSIGFALAHLSVVAVWIAINVGLTAFQPFDPFPFSFLGVLVGLEAVFLSTFVLMAQKRQARQAEHWTHLILQIGLLSEQEATKTLQMLTLVCNHMGLKTSQDQELKDMVEKTAIHHLAQELAENRDNPHDAEALPPSEASLLPPLAKRD